MTQVSTAGPKPGLTAVPLPAALRPASAAALVPASASLWRSQARRREPRGIDARCSPPPLAPAPQALILCRRFFCACASYCSHALAHRTVLTPAYPKGRRNKYGGMIRAQLGRFKTLSLLSFLLDFKQEHVVVGCGVKDSYCVQRVEH